MALAAVCGSARADGYSLHVLGALQAAWTDNLFSQPDGDLKEPDFYYQIRPGAMMTYETPRTVHQLSLDLDANLYQDHGGYTVQYMAGWRGFFLVSPRSEAGASATWSQGALSALTMSGTAGDGVIDDGTAQAGDSEATFTSLDLGQSYSFTPTREVRLTQGARARYFGSETGAEAKTSGTEIGLSAGADRGWKFSAVALQLSSSYVSLERSPSAEPPTDTVNSSAVVSWRRDFGPRWSSLLDAGVTSIVPLDDGEIVVQPTVGAGVSYAPNWGSAGLQIRRSVAPNLYLAQNTINDSAIINAWLPLPWLTDDPLLPKLTMQGTLGVQRSQLITSDGTIQSGFDLMSGDLAINYVPRDGVVVAARAQHIRQMRDDDAVMPNVNDYDRTTFMLTFSGRFPDRLAAEIPQRSSMRVDRSNNTAVGEEVAPPASQNNP